MLSLTALLVSTIAHADPPHDGVAGPAREWMPHAMEAARPHPVNPQGQRAGTYVPLRDPADRPSVTVYGYWPYWTDPLSTMQWDQLTHIAIFDVGVDSNGNLLTTSNWTNNAANAMNLAAPYGVQVHLAVTSFSDATQAAVLNDPAKRTRLVNNLRTQVNAYGADGVNVDFEGLEFALKNQFVSFLQELAGQVGEVYVAMPAVDWAGAYDFDQIALATDGLFIMGYDYYGGWGNPGPSAPLYGSARWGSYALDWTLTDYRTWGTPDPSIVMGLPLYGNNWATTNNNVPGTANGNSSSVLFSSGVTDFVTYGRRFDTASDSTYTFRTATSQEWVDDAGSVETKADWAVSEGIQGIGFWALGYDDEDLELWSGLDAVTHQGGMQITVSPGVAGQNNTWTVTGAPANRTVQIRYGAATVGSTAIAGCGNDFQITNAVQLAQGTSNAQGRYTFTRMVPANYSGVTGRFQAVATATCKVSSVLIDTF